VKSSNHKSRSRSYIWKLREQLVARKVKEYVHQSRDVAQGNLVTKSPSEAKRFRRDGVVTA